MQILLSEISKSRNFQALARFARSRILLVLYFKTPRRWKIQYNNNIRIIYDINKHVFLPPVHVYFIVFQRITCNASPIFGHGSQIRAKNCVPPQMEKVPYAYDDEHFTHALRVGEHV